MKIVVDLSQEEVDELDTCVFAADNEYGEHVLASVAISKIKAAQHSVKPTPESGGELPAIESNDKGSTPAKSG